MTVANINEHMLARILETSTEAFYALDRDWNFTYVNPAGAKFLHGTQEDLIGHNIWDLFPYSRGSAFEFPVRRAMEEGIPQTIEEFYDPFGAWICVSIHPWDNGVTVSVRDVTERRKRDITEQKELEEQLRQSQKMEAVGRLAGGIAHDFNNLLTVICTNSELALAQLTAEDTLHQDLSEISAAVERAKALTGQLLTFSRKHVTHTTVLDFNKVLEETQIMLRRVVGEDVNVIVNLSPGKLCVEADAIRLEQVMINLAVNARDAMPEGGAILFDAETAVLDSTSAARLGLMPGKYASLSVSDTGTGIDESVLPHIFDPFFTTKAQGKGTGLGLSTVYGIVQQFKGAIKVDSKMGRGTTFTIYLPYVEAVEDPITSRSVSDVLIPRGNEVVLLVEDEDGVREAARRALETQGYTVVTASNGIEALIVFEENEGIIDLVLTDVVMPEINGTMLAERLHQRTPGLPIVFMSGYTGEVTEHLRAVADSFIEKPFTIGGLMRKVRGVLDEKKRAAA